MKITTWQYKHWVSGECTKIYLELSICSTSLTPTQGYKKTRDTQCVGAKWDYNARVFTLDYCECNCLPALYCDKTNTKLRQQC